LNRADIRREISSTVNTDTVNEGLVEGPYTATVSEETLLAL